jgi:hypothetical protein
MNFTEVMGFIAGVLQLIVAGYALRLNRLFGPAHIGWSLFCAFSLLALLHLIQSLTSFNLGEISGVTIEVMYSLISLLLLVGMVHMETLLKERLRLAVVEQQLRAELESEVEKKTAHLTRAIEELETEIDERKRMETEVEKSNTQLYFTSRRLKTAEVAASILHNMGNMLKSVNASASIVTDQVKQSKIANVVHVGVLIREHAADLGSFMARDPRGQKLPQYIAELATHLDREQTALTEELETLKKYIDEIMAMQQSCNKSDWRGDPAGVASQPIFREQTDIVEQHMEAVEI